VEAVCQLTKQGVAGIGRHVFNDEPVPRDGKGNRLTRLEEQIHSAHEPISGIV
jgi:hypothetical protein